MIPIPLYIYVEQRRHHDDDRLEHQVRLEVQGSDGAGFDFMVETDFYENPRVVDGDACLDLSVPLTHRLAFAAFDRAWYSQGWFDATAVSLWLQDARPWLRDVFAAEEAEQIENALTAWVNPAVKGREYLVLQG